MLEVEIVLGHIPPWKTQHEFDVVVLDAVVRRRRVVFGKLGHLLFELLCHRLRPFLCPGLCPESLELAFIIHSELFLDGLELIVQVVFPLLLVNLALHFLIDLLLDLEQLALDIEGAEQFHGPGLDIIVAEKVNLVVVVLDLDGSGNEIDKEREAVDRLECIEGLLRSHGRRPDDNGSLLLEGLRNHPGAVILGRIDVFEIDDIAGEEGLRRDNRQKIESHHSLKEGGDGAVRHLQDLHDPADRSEIEKVAPARVFDHEVGLGYRSDEGVGLLGMTDDIDGLLTSYRNRENHSRENYRVSQSEQRNDFREVGSIDLGHFHSLHDRDYVHFSPIGEKKVCIYLFLHICILRSARGEPFSSAKHIFLRTSDKDAGAIANPLMDRDTNQTSANLSDCLATYSRGIYCQSPCQRHLGGKNVFMILIIKKISLFLHSLSLKEDNIDANRQQLFLIEYD